MVRKKTTGSIAGRPAWREGKKPGKPGPILGRTIVDIENGQGRLMGRGELHRRCPERRRVRLLDDLADDPALPVARRPIVAHHRDDR